MNAGVQIAAENVVAALPSPQYINTSVTNYTIDTAILVRDSINTNPNIYLSCDKGNKKGNKNLAKFFCWYDITQKSAYIFA